MVDIKRLNDKVTKHVAWENKANANIRSLEEENRRLKQKYSLLQLNCTNNHEMKIQTMEEQIKTLQVQRQQYQEERTTSSSDVFTRRSMVEEKQTRSIHSNEGLKQQQQQQQQQLLHQQQHYQQQQDLIQQQQLQLVHMQTQQEQQEKEHQLQQHMQQQRRSRRLHRHTEQSESSRGLSEIARTLNIGYELEVENDIERASKTFQQCIDMANEHIERCSIYQQEQEEHYTRYNASEQDQKQQQDNVDKIDKEELNEIEKSMALCYKYELQYANYKDRATRAHKDCDRVIKELVSKGLTSGDLNDEHFKELAIVGKVANNANSANSASKRTVVERSTRSVQQFRSVAVNEAVSAAVALGTANEEFYSHGSHQTSPAKGTKVALNLQHFKTHAPESSSPKAKALWQTVKRHVKTTLKDYLEQQRGENGDGGGGGGGGNVKEQMDHLVPDSMKEYHQMIERNRIMSSPLETPEALEREERELQRIPREKESDGGGKDGVKDLEKEVGEEAGKREEAVTKVLVSSSSEDFNEEENVEMSVTTTSSTVTTTETNNWEKMLLSRVVEYDIEGEDESSGEGEEEQSDRDRALQWFGMSDPSAPPPPPPPLPLTVSPVKGDI